jgi:hypothetical protein
VISAKRASRIREHLNRAIALSRKITDPYLVDETLREEIFNLNTLDLVCDKHELDWPIKGWKLRVMQIAKLLFLPHQPSVTNRKSGLTNLSIDREAIDI